MSSTIRIGTRNSQLAFWQAKLVCQHLEKMGYKCELVPISTNGDNNTVKPLYELGIQGVFTRALDCALLKKDIDIAVHSLKDVPTSLAKGIAEYAILQRGDPSDVLVFKTPPKLNKDYTVGTSSLRRQQQWLNRYHNHKVVNLRGNINTRLEKLSKTPIDAAILAFSGLERLSLMPENSIILDWMVPAPAQGALGIFGLEDNPLFNDIKKLNHQETAICVGLERAFLKVFERGCSAPIGAYAKHLKDSISFKGTISCAKNPSKIIRISENIPIKGSKEKVVSIATKIASDSNF